MAVLDLVRNGSIEGKIPWTFQDEARVVMQGRETWSPPLPPGDSYIKPHDDLHMAELYQTRGGPAGLVQSTIISPTIPIIVGSSFDIRIWINLWEIDANANQLELSFRYGDPPSAWFIWLRYHPNVAGLSFTIDWQSLPFLGEAMWPFVTDTPLQLKLKTYSSSGTFGGQWFVDHVQVWQDIAVTGTDVSDFDTKNPQIFNRGVRDDVYGTIHKEGRVELDADGRVRRSDDVDREGRDDLVTRWPLPTPREREEP